ncbi:MAG: hypothetical protein ACR2MY_10590 [Candidatus Dormibacteria bacterium]
METQVARRQGLAAARRRLTRLKVTALTTTVISFGAISAELASHNTSRVVASSVAPVAGAGPS